MLEYWWSDTFTDYFRKFEVTRSAWSMKSNERKVHGSLSCHQRSHGNGWGVSWLWGGVQTGWASSRWASSRPSEGLITRPHLVIYLTECNCWQWFVRFTCQKSPPTIVVLVVGVKHFRVVSRALGRCCRPPRVYVVWTQPTLTPAHPCFKEIQTSCSDRRTW